MLLPLLNEPTAANLFLHEERCWEKSRHVKKGQRRGANVLAKEEGKMPLRCSALYSGRESCWRVSGRRRMSYHCRHYRLKCGYQPRRPARAARRGYRQRGCIRMRHRSPLSVFHDTRRIEEAAPRCRPRGQAHLPASNARSRRVLRFPPQRGFSAARPPTSPGASRAGIISLPRNKHRSPASSAVCATYTAYERHSILLLPPQT